MNLNEMIETEIDNGYGYDNARSKVCQDIILKAISGSSLSRKDIYDMYYLSGNADKNKLSNCLTSFIYDDPKMKEDDIDGVIRRVDSAFKSRTFINRLESSDKRWLDEDVKEVTGGILEILENIKR